MCYATWRANVRHAFGGNRSVGPLVFFESRTPTCSVVKAISTQLPVPLLPLWLLLRHLLLLMPIDPSGCDYRALRANVRHAVGGKARAGPLAFFESRTPTSSVVKAISTQLPVPLPPL